jgi:hypothetical protein
VHGPIFESFERFRRSLRDPEIVTLDGLYLRACMILDSAAVDEQGSDRLISDEADNMPF